MPTDEPPPSPAPLPAPNGSERPRVGGPGPAEPDPSPPRLVRSFVTVSSLTLASRVLGFFRDVLSAAVLGASPVADAFFVALKLPNFLRRLFAEGAFNAAFVPMFSKALHEQGKEAAREVSARAQALLVSCLAIVVLSGVLTLPLWLRLLAPGFDPEGQRFSLSVELSRITFPYILLISLVALYGGVLHSIGRFAASAAAPIWLNVALLTGLALAATSRAEPAHVLAWCVLAGGALQLGWILIFARRAGFALPLRRPALTGDMRRLLAALAPGALGAGVTQISVLANLVLSSLLPAGAISSLYYADRLVQLPLGVIGAAVGTALLPLLVGQLSASPGGGEALASQNRAIELSLLLTLPACCGLVLLRGPLIAALFQRGAFDAGDAAATSQALASYALGLPAHVLVKVLSPGYFARCDTKTPVRMAIVSLVGSWCAAALLIGPLGHVGIALSTALSGWLNAGQLGFGLVRRGWLRIDAPVVGRTARIGSCCALMSAVVVGVAHACRGQSSYWVVALGVGAGAATYAASAIALGLRPELGPWQRPTPRRRRG